MLPVVEPELFWATVGGMGLTGHILEVEFRMKRIPVRGSSKSASVSETSTR
jgi:hypothetical protein